MLHLAWHFDLRNEEANDRYHWVDPDLPKPRLRSVAALCRQIWRKNGKNAIPYAFSHPSDCFDGGTGEFLLGPTKLGLTCATFVLAVFESAGIRLIDYASPVPARSGDREWQEKIVDLLERQGATSEHVDAVKGQIGGVRYRPEDVAGGATVSPLPAQFDLAAERGRQIVERLQSQ